MFILACYIGNLNVLFIVFHFFLSLSENFPPKIINTPSAINATLHQTVQLNITAEDNDEVTFLVINKPEGATVNVYGNLLYFTWPVRSSQKVA